MKKILIGLASLIACSFLQAHDVITISEAIGHQFAELATDNGFAELKMDLFLKGLKNYSTGKTFPNIDSEETLDINKESDLSLLSEAAGYLCGQVVDIVFTCDHKYLIKGIEDHIAGETSPLTEDELELSVDLIAKKAPKAMADNFIKLIEAFNLDDDEE